MTLSAKNKAYLDELRERIKRKHVEYNEEDLLKLSSVYGQVLEFSGIKGGGKIDKSCSSCIMEPVKILFNYITYHEPVVPVHRATIVKEVKPAVEWGNDNTFPKKIVEMSEKEATVKQEPSTDETFKSIKDTGIQDTADHLKAIHEAHTPPPTPVKKTRRPRTVKPKK